MIRARALKVLLVVVGLACLAGLYPLAGALRDGTASTINRQDQMILSIYISLGVFLLNASRNPSAHRSLVLFAGWSTHVVNVFRARVRRGTRDDRRTDGANSR